MRVLSALFALAVVAFVATGCSAVKEASKSDTAKASVGSCIKINKASATDADTEPKDCSAEDATYKVAKSFDTKTDCPTQAYTSYTETFGSSTTSYLCLVENFQEGKCYKADVVTNIYQPADCAADAELQVVKRIDGQEDEALCAIDAGETPLTFPEPKLTYCVIQP